MVAAAPGITDEQKAAITADIEKMVNSAAWKKTLAEPGWIDTYLAGDGSTRSWRPTSRRRRPF